MKAFVYERYGSPDVLELTEVDRPTVGENEVLVRVRALSVNPAEWHFLKPTMQIARLAIGLRKPRNPILGADLAGTVEEVGAAVTGFRPGDDVYGRSNNGGFAEFASVREGGLAPKPPGTSFEEAAAVPVAALSALQSLREGQVQSGMRLLVNGASGGVGTFTVQLARAYGADVTGVCSTRNMELVRSIGADHLIDYTKEDFTRNGQRYDLIIDAVGNRSVPDYRRAMSQDGRCVVVGFTGMARLLEVFLLGQWVSRTSGQRIGSMIASVRQEDFLILNEFLASGQVVPVIDRRYPFHELPEALRYLGTKRARGKVTVLLDSNGLD